MKKILLLIILLHSALANANNIFYKNGFNRNFYDNINRINDFRQYFQQQNNIQTRQYFNTKTNEYILEVKINNVDKNNITVKEKNGFLILKVSVEKINKFNYSSGSFYQAIYLPNDADKNNIKTKFNENILKISISKIKK